jgi:tellurium resistance protein TerD
MSVKLAKGQNISLKKEAPALTTATIGLGWDAKAGDGAFDLDGVAFMLNAEGKVASDNAFIFYSNKESACGSVIHSGDNRTGEGDGDDESMQIDISKIPENVVKIVFAVNIHDSEQRKQNFGQVSNSVIRFEDSASKEEVCKYELDEDYSAEQAMIFGELYLRNDEWKFKAVGEGFTGGLKEMCTLYGVNAD